MTKPICGGDTPSTGRSQALIAALWPVFTEAVLERLDMGARQYGDKSLDLDSTRLLVEIEQEMLDVMGWGFLLFSRIQLLKEKLERIEQVAR